VIQLLDKETAETSRTGLNQQEEGKKKKEKRED
jgi:hypothetical protein